MTLERQIFEEVYSLVQTVWGSDYRLQAAWMEEGLILHVQVIRELDEWILLKADCQHSARELMRVNWSNPNPMRVVLPSSPQAVHIPYEPNNIMTVPALGMAEISPMSYRVWESVTRICNDLSKGAQCPLCERTELEKSQRGLLCLDCDYIVVPRERPRWADRGLSWPGVQRTSVGRSIA